MTTCLKNLLFSVCVCVFDYRLGTGLDGLLTYLVLIMLTHLTMGMNLIMMMTMK